MSTAVATASFAARPSSWACLLHLLGPILAAYLSCAWCCASLLSLHLLGVFLLEEKANPLGCGVYSESLSAGGSAAAKVPNSKVACMGMDCVLCVRVGVCEARCTDVDHQGYQAPLCGGGGVLQPVELDYMSPFATALATT
jgi:hypothetical protein